MEDDPDVFGGDKVNALCMIKMRDLLGNNMQGHDYKNYQLFYDNKGVQTDGGHVRFKTTFMPGWYIGVKDAEKLH